MQLLNVWFGMIGSAIFAIFRHSQIDHGRATRHAANGQYRFRYLSTQIRIFSDRITICKIRIWETDGIFWTDRVAEAQTCVWLYLRSFITRRRRGIGSRKWRERDEREGRTADLYEKRRNAAIGTGGGVTGCFWSDGTG